MIDKSNTSRRLWLIWTTVASFLLTTPLGAQLFTPKGTQLVCDGAPEGFSQGIPDGWSVIDGTGDGLVWSDLATRPSPCLSASPT